MSRFFDFTSVHADADSVVTIMPAVVTSGLLAALPEGSWKTLCVLAALTDAHGRYPREASKLARALGESPAVAAHQLARLEAFRWHGQPLLAPETEGAADGRWLA